MLWPKQLQGVPSANKRKHMYSKGRLIQSRIPTRKLWQFLAPSQRVLRNPPQQPVGSTSLRKTTWEQKANEQNVVDHWLSPFGTWRRFTFLAFPKSMAAQKSETRKGHFDWSIRLGIESTHVKINSPSCYGCCNQPLEQTPTMSLQTS